MVDIRNLKHMDRVWIIGTVNKIAMWVFVDKAELPDKVFIMDKSWRDSIVIKDKDCFMTKEDLEINIKNENK